MYSLFISIGQSLQGESLPGVIFFPLAEEGLVLDTWSALGCPHWGRDYSSRSVRTTGHLGKLAASCRPCGWRGDPELY